LTREDARALVLVSDYVIVVNDAWEWVPDADLLYAADYRWWVKREAVTRENFKGRRATLCGKAATDFGLDFVPCLDLDMAKTGLSPSEDGIYHGYSGGFQALHIAAMMKPERIALLGYDYGATGQGNAVPSPIHGSYSDFQIMRKAFDYAAPQLVERGIRVVNLTRSSSLRCFEEQEVSIFVERAIRHRSQALQQDGSESRTGA
jgi:hypothetical protein